MMQEMARIRYHPLAESRIDSNRFRFRFSLDRAADPATANYIVDIKRLVT
jgi:hypothetical protein